MSFQEPSGTAVERRFKLYGEVPSDPALPGGYVASGPDSKLKETEGDESEEEKAHSGPAQPWDRTQEGHVSEPPRSVLPAELP